jgi:hypothetical protein
VLDGETERGAFPEDVLLADEVFQLARAKANRERGVLRLPCSGCFREEVSHGRSMLRA